MSAKYEPCLTCESTHIAIKCSFMHRLPFYAECRDCGERGPREHTVEHAKKSWNTRAGEKA